MPVIPVDLLRPLLEEWHTRYTWRQMSWMTGLPERVFWRIMNESEGLEFNTLDKILTGMESLEHWQTTFADYYLAEVS